MGSSYYIVADLVDESILDNFVNIQFTAISTMILNVAFIKLLGKVMGTKFPDKRDCDTNRR